MTRGYIHALETFGLVDGPGVRTVVFLQGCPMRCRYCHNPETWQCGDSSIDETECAGLGWQTAEEVFTRVCRYKNYWRDHGGITVSGGEPLLQSEFVTELFERAKEQGIHTTLDTSGSPFSADPGKREQWERLLKVTDLVLLDIKEMDEQKHRELTGQTNENILAMGDYLAEIGQEVWVRHVLVPGLTDAPEGLRALRKRLDQWKNVTRVEVLPYHTLGLFKWEKLGIPYSLQGVRTPTEEEVRTAEELLGVRKEGE